MSYEIEKSEMSYFPYSFANSIDRASEWIGKKETKSSKYYVGYIGTTSQNLVQGTHYFAILGWDSLASAILKIPVNNLKLNYDAVSKALEYALPQPKERVEITPSEYDATTGPWDEDFSSVADHDDIVKEQTEQFEKEMNNNNQFEINQRFGQTENLLSIVKEQAEMDSVISKLNSTVDIWNLLGDMIVTRAKNLPISNVTLVGVWDSLDTKEPLSITDFDGMPISFFAYKIGLGAEMGHIFLSGHNKLLPEGTIIEKYVKNTDLKSDRTYFEWSFGNYQDGYSSGISVGGGVCQIEKYFGVMEPDPDLDVYKYVNEAQLDDSRPFDHFYASPQEITSLTNADMGFYPPKEQ